MSLCSLIFANVSKGHTAWIFSSSETSTTYWTAQCHKSENDEARIWERLRSHVIRAKVLNSCQWNLLLGVYTESGWVWNISVISLRSYGLGEQDLIPGKSGVLFIRRSAVRLLSNPDSCDAESLCVSLKQQECVANHWAVSTVEVTNFPLHYSSVSVVTRLWAGWPRNLG